MSSPSRQACPQTAWPPSPTGAQPALTLVRPCLPCGPAWLGLWRRNGPPPAGSLTASAAFLHSHPPRQALLPALCSRTGRKRAVDVLQLRLQLRVPQASRPEAGWTRASMCPARHHPTLKRPRRRLLPPAQHACSAPRSALPLPAPRACGWVPMPVSPQLLISPCLRCPRSGTSMATPIVSGAAALLFAAKPDATLQEVK